MRPTLFDASGRRVQRTAGFNRVWWDAGRTPAPRVGEAVEAIGFEAVEAEEDERGEEEQPGDPRKTAGTSARALA